jgi:hypothetical protein
MSSDMVRRQFLRMADAEWLLPFPPKPEQGSRIPRMWNLRNSKPLPKPAIATCIYTTLPAFHWCRARW